MLPTYNEAQNIVRLLDELFALNLADFHVLVVDDYSTDGTWQLVEEYADRNPAVHLLLRKKRRGRGTAGVDGFKWILETDARYILEMDADFSHQPKHIPAMLAAMDRADLVLGSRFVPGGSDSDRGFVRQQITKAAGLYVRTLLKLRVRDVSSGFRLFRREVLEAIDVENLISAGPSIVLEILYKSVLQGFRLAEVPIEFIDRRQGETKLDWITLLETLVMVLRLRQLHKTGKIPTAPPREGLSRT